MKINRTNRTASSAVRRTGVTAGAGGGFRLGDVDGAGATGNGSPAGGASGLGGTVSLGSVDALLAVQQADEAGNFRHGRRKAVGRGEALLELLDRVRVDLLTGGVPKSRLEALVRLVESRREAFEDPKLSSILDDIELRARVEIAKLQK